MGERSGLSRVLFDALYALPPQGRKRLRRQPLASAPLALPLLPTSFLRLECSRLANLVRTLPAMRRLRSRKNLHAPGRRRPFHMAKTLVRFRRLPLPRLPRPFLQQPPLSTNRRPTRIQTSRSQVAPASLPASNDLSVKSTPRAKTDSALQSVPPP